MRRMSKRSLIVAMAGLLGALLILPGIAAARSKGHKYRYSEIDMPVSLAVGTIRTPEFPVIPQSYDILLAAEKRIPFADLRCMMGLKDGTLDFKDCNNEPLIQADWTVWSDGHVVSQGSNSGFGPAKFTNENVFKFLGSFAGEAGKKYVVDVKFTKDGTPLNATNPHLIIIQHRYH